MSDFTKPNQHKSSQALAARFYPTRTLLVAGFAALGLVACGGGGDGDSGGPGGGGPGGSGPGVTDNIPTTTSLSEIYQLTGDANQSYPLFYVDASNDNGKTDVSKAAAPWLMAYNPVVKTTEVIDKKLSGLTSTFAAVSPLALHEADVDVSNGEINNYRISSVTYIREKDQDIGGGTMFTFPDTLMRVDVTAGSTPTQITNESSISADLGFSSPRQIIAFNLKDAEKALYVFPSSDSGKSYRLTPLDASPSTPVKDFAPDIDVQVPVHQVQGTDAGTTYGWVVADSSQDDCLAFVSNSDLSDVNCIPNSDGTGKVTFASNSSPITGQYPVNNGMVLAIPEPGSAGSLQVKTTLWFYEQSPGSGNAGKLYLLKNNGETLQTTGLPMFGPNEAGRVVSKDGDTLYLAASDGGIGGLFGGDGQQNPFDVESHVFLFKITTSGNIAWEQVFHEGGKLTEDKGAFLGDFLVDAGRTFIWEINDRLIAISPDGQSQTLLDGRINDGGNAILGTGAFNTPVGAVSQNGWFFYNRELNSTEYATAIKVDGSKRVELENCTWVGASTSGKAKYTGGSFASLEPSEVFMACNNRQIAAVDANSPDNGRIILGSLTREAETIAMGRAAPGPHRLMQVVYEGANNDSFEVVAVNTRESGSLNYLMASPASDDDVEVGAGSTAPVDGF